MDNWLSSITAWLAGLVTAAFAALVTWVHDAAWWAFDGVLQALAGAVSAISVPSFMSAGINIGSIFSGFPPFALYMIGQLGLGACFAALSAGIAFRLVRKVVTLGQW